MTDITPPPALVQQWMAEFYGTVVAPGEATTDIATRAAQWGADQELEACCKEMTRLQLLESLPNPLNIPFGEMASNALRAARRPKPPSLKLQALNDLNTAYNEDAIDDTTYCNIRRALEELPDD